MEVSHESLIKSGFIHDEENSNYYHREGHHWLRVQRFICNKKGILLIDGKQYTFLDNMEKVCEVYRALTDIEF